MVDVVLLTVPLLELKSPITGPYLLKSILQENDISCKVYDFNVYLWDAIGGIARDLWDANGTVFGVEEQLNKYAGIIMPVVKKFVADVLAEGYPNWIGATQFAWTSGYITKWIFNEFKRQGFSGKTLLGGPHCMEYDEDHHMWGYADHVIYGEAEESIVELIKGNLNYPGIDKKNFKQISNLNDFPYPDYSDIEFDKYPILCDELYAPDAWHNDNDKLTQLYITGSRGCVRHCTFCDIQAMAPKYKYRSGKSIAEEIVHHYTRWNITHFNFTDSLINGAVKVFDDFLTNIIAYKEQGLLPQNLRLWGQAIARPEHQTPPGQFERIVEAGFRSLSIGIESGSEAVRHHMKKKFSNADIDFTFNMAEKSGLRISILMIVGYPTETEKDFQDTLDLFTRHATKAEKTLTNVAIGPTMVILPYAPISNDLYVMGIKGDANGDWMYDENTLEIRLDRWLRLREHLIELGFKVSPDRHSKQIREYREKLQRIKTEKGQPTNKSYIERYGYKNVFK